MDMSEKNGSQSGGIEKNSGVGHYDPPTKVPPAPQPPPPQPKK